MATHKLPALPYEPDGLAPAISRETMEYHYGKHLQTYLDNLNRLIAGTPFEKASLEEIILRAEGPLYNNAAQSWNHIFFFQGLSPDPIPMPTGLAEALNRDFGSPESFREQFTAAALGLFGSGWVFLSSDTDGKLTIQALPNAGNPLRDGKTPLLTLDVWEHAYYIDYRNRRADFIAAWWQLVNWNKVWEKFGPKFELF